MKPFFDSSDRQDSGADAYKSGDLQNPTLAPCLDRSIQNIKVIRPFASDQSGVAHVLKTAHSGHRLSQIAQIIQFLIVIYGRDINRTNPTNILGTPLPHPIPSLLPLIRICITPGALSIEHRRFATVGKHRTKAP